MSPSWYTQRQLFRHADVSDKIAFFQSLLDSRELTPDAARALLHVIHVELRDPVGRDPAIYKRYAALGESFRAQMPGVYQQVFGRRGIEATVYEGGVSSLVAGLASEKATSTFSRVAKYILIRLLAIFATIFIGVFVTVVLANQGGQVDLAVEDEVTAELNRQFPGWWWMGLPPEELAIVNQAKGKLEEAAGLNLPYWPRQVLWTFKALRLDWSEEVSVRPAPGSFYPSKQVKDIILTDFPHTLLLIGTAFLLLFLLGIPLALFLFRKQGGLLDRLITMLAPISSIPSWVLGVILILIFAATLHLLPAEGMLDTLPADTSWQRMLIVLKHMVLPVLAIVLSLFFQCVYSWRTFLLLYAEEDYVELAKAKGLSNRIIGRQYILRPTLIYILTSFAIMLTGFWQMTIALEKVINWPGIGRLYILSLPNFFGENFYPGIMSITLSIVVLFAYLMGITVFMLDISYPLVDPRVRIGDEKQTVREVVVKARRRSRFWPRREALPAARYTWARDANPAPSAHFNLETKARFSDWLKAFKKRLDAIKPVFREIVCYPSAVFGLIVILILVGGSIYAITAFPYDQLGRVWYTGMLSGRVYAPKFAQPAWVNWLRRDKLP